MNLKQLQPGDVVYAACAIENDGSIPAMEDTALLATPGTRGVIVNIGHLEEDPERELYLVRFEDPALNLGPPTGCWPEELSVEPSGASIAQERRQARIPGPTRSRTRSAPEGVAVVAGALHKREYQ